MVLVIVVVAVVVHVLLVVALKVPPHDMSAQDQKGGGGTARTHSQPSTRSWVVTTTPRLPLSRKRPGTDRAGGWVAFGAGGEGTEILDPQRDSIPRPSNL